MTRSLISVVVPVYRCADCLAELHGRLAASLVAVDVDWELILVDDRSPDASWRAMQAIAREDPRVRLLRLSRNFGQHVAVTAGVAHSKGDWIVLMDCDLQDRPEDIARLYAEAVEGYDIVFSRRLSRRQTLFRRLAARAYFKVRRLLTQIEIDPDLGSMMLFSRKVADAFLDVKDRDRQHAIILAWLGFDRTLVQLQHDDRFAGRSSYTLRKLLASGMNGLFFQTTNLLTAIVAIGVAVAASGFALAGGLIAWWAVRNPPPGWTSLAVLILVIGGIGIFSLGVTALYVGKVFDQVKGRPLYVIDEIVEADEGAPDPGAPTAVESDAGR